jgi:hypothetical protein
MLQGGSGLLGQCQAPPPPRVRLMSSRLGLGQAAPVMAEVEDQHVLGILQLPRTLCQLVVA